jgi:hypothetical protein
MNGRVILFIGITSENNNIKNRYGSDIKAKCNEKAITPAMIAII